MDVLVVVVVVAVRILAFWMPWPEARGTRARLRDLLLFGSMKRIVVDSFLSSWCMYCLLYRFDSTAAVFHEVKRVQSSGANQVLIVSVVVGIGLFGNLHDLNSRAGRCARERAGRVN